MSINEVYFIFPTEICYSIISHLDSEDAAAFAKCSRFCYSVAFPSRFSGIKLHDDNHKRLLKMFTNGGWLVPLKDHIRSMNFTIYNLDTLQDLYSAALIFPNLQSLTVNIFSFWILQRNAYYTLFRDLSALPFYDNIDHFAFIWFGTDEEWYNDIANYRLLPDVERSTAGLYEWTMRQFPKARDLLGPFIPENQFSEKVEEILLPKALQSFEANLGFTSKEYDYLLPVVSSATVETLSIHRASYPFTGDFNFRNIKNLTLIFNSAKIDICQSYGLELLSRQFPNLESLKIINAEWDVEESSRFTFRPPVLPKIAQLDISWPRPAPHRCRTKALERFLGLVLNGKDGRNLERCTFRGTTYTIAGPRNVVATCVISKRKIFDPDFPSKPWEFQWEGDIDFDQMEDDWGAWADLEQDEDLDSDYVASGDEEHGSSILSNDIEEESGSGDSEFSGDSEYPEAGDELYPVDTDDELEQPYRLEVDLTLGLA
ncbi:hypothetical protein AOL_s00078g466 [Orbilia oligospora ATCC 24927]|uniref:F-box domain-containing protein n=1 Tax=Arthrobotrys oligospora (strain ATCC 24927 / CBS 115.81 / DSM 1491) TaxID=756982 RepID=G1XC19_ARTOA|nr:hypothetical protein AOL_s00078g466 [Orbilia oligospora ATCC 24927]EGX49433.1 hypothetical protein AOL_s00078g466 [Orbilia oligospora ATCC 24927]